MERRQQGLHSSKMSEVSDGKEASGFWEWDTRFSSQTHMEQSCPSKSQFPYVALCSEQGPCEDRLMRFNILQEDSCCFCDTAGESQKHLFLLCPYAFNIWARLAFIFKAGPHVINDVFDPWETWIPPVVSVGKKNVGFGPSRGAVGFMVGEESTDIPSSHSAT